MPARLKLYPKDSPRPVLCVFICRAFLEDEDRKSQVLDICLGVVFVSHSAGSSAAAESQSLHRFCTASTITCAHFHPMDMQRSSSSVSAELLSPVTLDILVAQAQGRGEVFRKWVGLPGTALCWVIVSGGFVQSLAISVNGRAPSLSIVSELVQIAAQVVQLCMCTSMHFLDCAFAEWCSAMRGQSGSICKRWQPSSLMSDVISLCLNLLPRQAVQCVVAASVVDQTSSDSMRCASM